MPKADVMRTCELYLYVKQNAYMNSKHEVNDLYVAMFCDAGNTQTLKQQSITGIVCSKIK